MRPVLIAILFFLGLKGSAQSTSTFISKWKTYMPGETNSTSVLIPTNPAYEYNYDVDWDNDGVFDEFGLKESAKHDYEKEISVNIAIRGIFPIIYFNNAGDKNKILSIVQWGEQKWLDFNSAFEGCSNLIIEAQDTPDLSLVTLMSKMFRGATNFNGDLKDWDVSNVTNMDSMFQEAENFNGDISGWNIWQCNSINYMFHKASSFNRDISEWNTFSIEKFKYVFAGAYSFDQDLGDWNISDITDMTGMFDDSGMSRRNYDKTLIGWSEQNVMSDVTLGAKNLSYCNSIHSRSYLASTPYDWVIEGDHLDCQGAPFITTWKTNNPGVSDSLTIRIPIQAGLDYKYDIDWENDGIYDLIGVTDERTHTYSDTGTYQVAIRGAFPRIYFPTGSLDNEKLVSIDQWGEIEWSSLNRAFYQCSNLTYNATDIPDLSKVGFISDMFFGCSRFNGAIGDWDVSKVLLFSNMFAYTDSFNQDLSKWDVSRAVSISGMFQNTESFNQDLSKWDVSQVVDMSFLFSDAEAFNQDLNNWDVSNVRDMSRMFRNADTFNQDLNEWTVDSVQDMSDMFAYCDLFNGDISQWKTDSVKTMKRMFEKTGSFNQDIGNWNTSAVSDAESMFSRAYHFDQNLVDWDISNMTNMTDMLESSGLSTVNYDSTLIGWASQDVQPGIILGAHGLTYCSAAMARNTLMSSPNNWTIVDDEENCIDLLPCMTTTVNRWLYNQSSPWHTNIPQRWTQGSIPTVCHEVITRSGNLITIPYDRKAECFSLDVVSNSELEIEMGAILEVWGQQQE